MSVEKFCLKWNDYEKNISTAFKDIRDENDFLDVTLACEDEQLKAHKVILSACSPFFKEVLRRNNHPHPLLYLRGVSLNDMKAVLNFMYHGEVNVAQDDLNSFLQVAEDLKVKGLTQNNTNNKPTKPESKANVAAPPDNTWSQENKYPPPTTLSRHHQLEEIELVEQPIKSEPRDTPQSIHDTVHQEQKIAMYDINHHQQESMMQQYDENNDPGYDAEFVEQGYENTMVYHGEQDTTGAGKDQCPICLKKMLKNNVQKHIRMKHSEEEQSECPECGKCFKTTYNMKEHLRRYHGLGQRIAY